MYQKFFKRLIDIVLSACGIVVLAVPMLLIALAVRLDSKGPVLFWQKRIGINKSTYMMPKYRSMYCTAPANMPTHLLSSPEKWITPVGRILRRTSLDELPQLFSILKGDMSIVGPRPALWNQDDLVAQRDKYGANSIRPGLTGWAQVNGRRTVEWNKRIEYNIWYAENVSLLLDLKIVWMTIFKVLSRVDNENFGETVSKK